MIDYTKKYSESEISVDSGLKSYMLLVYNYVCIGLLISAISGLAVITVPFLRNLVFGTPIGMIITLAHFIIAFYFSFKQHAMNVDKAKNLFWLYSLLTGIALSHIGLIYTGQSIVKTLLICASLFGVMSIYGNSTKRDLTSFGSFLQMGLFGLIIASLVNIFTRSSQLEFITSFIGVIIFTGLIAYDTKKIKSYYYLTHNQEALRHKVAIMGAFTLYVDLIGLFIHLLRFFGIRKND